MMPRDGELSVFGAHLIAFINTVSELCALTGEDPAQCRERILVAAFEEFKTMSPTELRQTIILNLMPIVRRQR